MSLQAHLSLVYHDRQHLCYSRSFFGGVLLWTGIVECDMERDIRCSKVFSLHVTRGFAGALYAPKWDVGRAAVRNGFGAFCPWNLASGADVH